MSTINPYSNVAIHSKNTTVTKVEKPEPTEKLSKAEIIASKDLSPAQKMEALGIKPMSVDELASGLADKILDGEV